MPTEADIFQSKAADLRSLLLVKTEKQIAAERNVKINTVYKWKSLYEIRSSVTLQHEQRRALIVRLASTGTLAEIKDFLKLYRGEDLSSDAVRMAVTRAVGKRGWQKLRKRYAELRYEEKLARHFIKNCLLFIMWRYGIQLEIEYQNAA